MISQQFSRIALAVLLITATALFAAAATLAQSSVCTLADHIRSANTNTAVGFCPAGTSHDIITIAEDITLSEPLPPITGRITIEGGGHTISGDQQFRIFDVQGGNLAIKNLTLTDGRADHGGAVHLQAGSLFVYDSSFVGNRTERSAGAIYANGGTLQISNSRFEDNCAQFAAFTHRVGAERNSLFVDADGCTRFVYFRSPPDGEVQTNGDGGAIRLLNGAPKPLSRIPPLPITERLMAGRFRHPAAPTGWSSTGSSFFGNHASHMGGAIGAVWSGGGTSAVSNSSFVDNSARYAAGAIAATQQTMDISNSTFSQNHTDGNGGAFARRLGGSGHRNSCDLHRKPGTI